MAGVEGVNLLLALSLLLAAGFALARLVRLIHLLSHRSAASFLRFAG